MVRPIACTCLQPHRLSRCRGLIRRHHQSVRLQRIVKGLADAARIARFDGTEEGAGEFDFALTARAIELLRAFGRRPGAAAPAELRLALRGDDREAATAFDARLE